MGTVSYPSLAYTIVTIAVEAEFSLHSEECDAHSMNQVAETPEEFISLSLRRPQCIDKRSQILVKNVNRLLQKKKGKVIIAINYREHSWSGLVWFRTAYELIGWEQ